MNNTTKKQIKNDLYQFVQKLGSQMAASRQLVNVSHATICNILGDKWDNIADGMWISIEKQMSGSKVVCEGWQVLKDTKRMQLMRQLYNDAQAYSEVFCVVAPEGSGKTEPAKTYASHANVYFLQCKEHLNRKTFLGDLLTAMGKNSGGYTVYEMMQLVLETILRVENPLIVLDEADKISDQVLYFFITIYNETEGKCGLVLQATDHLKKRIMKGVAMNKKGYKEIYSRIGRKFVELPANTTDELKRIVEVNGVTDELEATRIVNDSEGDIRRVKRLVLAYGRKNGGKNAI